jgi:chemotaxis protein MotD
MNTGAVLQALASAEVADRAGVTSRQDAPADGDGAFRELLLKFASGEEQGSSASNIEGEARQHSSATELLDWLRSNSEALGLGPMPAEDQASGQGSADGELNGGDINALLQALGGGDAAAALAAMAGLAGRSPPAGDAALMHGAGADRAPDGATPEEIILAALAKAAGKTDGEPAEGQTLNATLTVIGRETHLAPSETVKSASAGSQWAVELATSRRLAAFASAAPDAASANAEPAPSVLGEGLMLRTGVAAAADAQLGPDGQGDRRSSSDPNVVAGLLAGTGGPDGTVIARSDRDVVSGLVQQIASQVASEAGTAVTEAARPMPAGFVVKPESAVKVLHLQLQPAELGTVTIRIAVKDNALRVDLEVGRNETAHLIQRERDALSALLRSAGYSIDGLDVRLADQTGSSMQGGGQSGLQMQGGQAGSSQSEARFSGERPHDERQGHSFGDRSNGDDEQAGQGHGGGGIYL